MADQVEVSGLDELRKTLRTLPEALQGKASQAALSKAAAPIVRAAKTAAPTSADDFIGPVGNGHKATGGRLRKAIYSYRNRQSTKTYESRLIGVRRNAWYWKFIEFGRASIEREKGSLGTPAKGFFGRVVKAIPARPFLRPAFETHKLRALEIYKAALQPAIEKFAKRAQSRSVRRLTRKLTGF